VDTSLGLRGRAERKTMSKVRKSGSTPKNTDSKLLVQAERMFYQAESGQATQKAQQIKGNNE